MKYQVARDGEVLGEWTATELYPLLRDNVLRPRDHYWMEGMSEWGYLAEIPAGKKHVASQAQRQMLDRHGIPFDQLTSKAEVSQLMDEFLSANQRRRSSGPSSLSTGYYVPTQHQCETPPSSSGV